ncbi:beta strand repeat-containing protein, partial [Flavobacterium sp. ARAG 55.4]|uniref:beta strand repeat-containing protein n=1 Tax=Flavobacterium sp. ARAG 55.4 TaxID=3451357 RepID=UPI003F449767
MRKNYPDLSNQTFTDIKKTRSGFRSLLLVIGFILLSLNSYGQCNVEIPTPFVSDNFDDLSVSTNTTGACAELLGCGIDNENRLTDTSLTNFATASFGVLSVGTNHSLRVTDGNTTYAAGTFAGFKISPSGGLLSLDLLNGVTIITYNDGNLRETFTGASLLSLNLLSGSDEYIVGFNTTQSFDAVEIVLNGGVALLSSTNIYHAVVREYCAGPALDCNTVTKMSLPTFPVAISQANTGMSGISVGSVSNVENAISSNDADYATIDLTVGLLASGSIAVKDQLTDYPAGTYAGFEIENTGLLNIAALGNVVVSTYLNGAVQEQFSGSDLVANVGLLPSAGRFKLGFVSTQAFDEVKLSLNQTVGLNLGTTRVYGAVFQTFCAGPALDCNTKTALTSPTFPVYVNNVNSGINGVLCALCEVVNQDNLVDADPNNYAEVNLAVGLGTTGSLSVKEQITDYPAGTFAGYMVENPKLLDVNALGAVRVTTFLNGVQQETKTGNGPLVAIGSDLLGGSGRTTIGFVSTTAFDEVQITFENLVSVNLGVVRVYNAVFERFCAGPALDCNTKTALTSPTYPVYINSDNTGVDGVLCALCTVVNQDNLIDADLTNYAEVNLSVGVGTTGSLSVKEQITDYPAGTFAGYTIENPALLTVGALDAVRVTTYLNGVQQETKTGNGPLVSVGTDLLVGTGRNTVGFVSTTPFDEVQITFENLASVNLGQVRVYNAVFQRLCDPVVECNEDYVLSNPDFPVVINGDRTGIDGVACVSCAVNNTDNLLTADQTDFANITLIAGVVGSGSVAVKDQLFTYPQGTFAGYVIRDLGTLAQVNLLQSLTISTYNNNVLQESRTAGQLIDLSLLGIDILGSTPGVYNVGFKTSLPFDEIRLTLNSIASVINSIDVYGAFVNTSESDGGPGSGLECNSSAVTITKDGTYVDANNDGITNVGDRIDYVFDVRNTGFETLTNVTVTDNNATVTGTPIASLAAGANDITSYTATYLITQADIDAGVVYNLATASATTNVGTTITATSTDPTPCATCPVNPGCTDCTATPLTQTNTIALVKTASVGGTGVLGDVITYTFSVTNTGNTTLTNVVVTDPLPGLVISGNPIATLTPGATNTNITGTYVITQADVDAGMVTNSALVTAKDPQNNNVTDISGTTITTDDNTETPVNQTNSIALVKTGSIVGAGGLGETITYTFAVKNTGTTTLTNVVVTDQMLGLTITGNPIATLAPGATNISIKGTYDITQADVDAGKVTNSALVTAQDPQNNDVTDISGTTLTTDDATETPVGQRSTIALVKSASVGGTGVLNDVITYTFEVTNTGTTTLTDIIVTDPMSGLIITGNPIATLAPGSTDTSITGTYTITQADVDAGKVVNQATVTANDPLNNPVTDISGTTIGTDDTTETPVTQTSSVALVKTAASVPGGTRILGDVITYNFSITNTGTTTLKNIVVSDPMVGLTITGNPIATLAPGAVNTTITGTYVITQADIDAGKVTNSALVIAKDPQNNNVTDVSGTTAVTDDATETPVTQTPAIALVKSGIYNGNATRASVGDTVTYTFSVTNTGNTTLNNVVVTDPMTGLVITGNPIATLGVGMSNATIKGTYTITQADIDAGVVSNTAIAIGQDPQGVDV